MAEGQSVIRDFLKCCVRWARSVSPRGNLWFWLLFLPVTGPFVSMVGDHAYDVVIRLSAVGIATLVAIWVSYLIRSYFDEDLELVLIQNLISQVDESKNIQAKASVIVSRALMVAASWLSRAIILIGFLWAIVLAFSGDYVT